jgi:Holliday junction resolvase RusA-like endonuclease
VSKSAFWRGHNSPAGAPLPAGFIRGQDDRQGTIHQTLQGEGVVVITIPGETPSLKNSKRIIYPGGHPRLIPSKQYSRWVVAALWQLKQHPAVGREWHYPVRVDFVFYRTTRRLFDYINAAQGPLDVLVEAGILAGDDMNLVKPGEWNWAIDKENPRVELTITEAK